MNGYMAECRYTKENTITKTNMASLEQITGLQFLVVLWLPFKIIVLL